MTHLWEWRTKDYKNRNKALGRDKKSTKKKIRKTKKNIGKAGVGKRWLKQMETNPSRLIKTAMSVSLYSDKGEPQTATSQIWKAGTSAALKSVNNLIQNIYVCQLSILER